jgi:thiamine pyrophosphokinase
LIGIVFTGGGAPAPDFIRNLLKGKEILSVAADSGLESAEAAGFRPDWVVGDMDSLDDSSRLSAYPPECVLRFDRDKDDTDTESALSLLFKKGCHCAWIIGGGGGRTDHLFGIRLLFERELFPARWITGDADIHCIEACCEARLDVGVGAVVSVFPAFSGPWKAESRGLKWPLDSLTWNRGFASMSNLALTGEVCIRAQEGRFLVIVPFSRGKGSCRR